jgi:hypothetical protein
MTSTKEDDPFKSASEEVEEAYEQAVSELKSKVNKAKSDALKKVTV